MSPPFWDDDLLEQVLAATGGRAVESDPSTPTLEEALAATGGRAVSELPSIQEALAATGGRAVRPLPMVVPEGRQFETGLTVDGRPARPVVTVPEAFQYDTGDVAVTEPRPGTVARLDRMVGQIPGPQPVVPVPETLSRAYTAMTTAPKFVTEPVHRAGEAFVVSSLAKKPSDVVGPLSSEDPQHAYESQAQIAGFVAGAADAAAQMASPVNVALAASGVVMKTIGTRIAGLAEYAQYLDRVRKVADKPEHIEAATAEMYAAMNRIAALETVQTAIQAGHGVAGAGYTVEGTKNLINADTWTDRALAVAEIAGGLTGAASSLRAFDNPLPVTNALLDATNPRGEGPPPRNVTPPPPKRLTSGEVPPAPFEEPPTGTPPGEPPGAPPPGAPPPPGSGGAPTAPPTITIDMRGYHQMRREALARGETPPTYAEWTKMQGGTIPPPAAPPAVPPVVPVVPPPTSPAAPGAVVPPVEETPSAEEQQADLKPDDTNAPIYYRSGSTSPADFDAYVQAGVPIGVVSGKHLTAPMQQRVVDYVNDGGHVFLDNGAFGAFMAELRGEPDPVDFDKVIAQYHDIADRASTQAEGRLTVVAPDIIGQQEATQQLQAHYAQDLRDLWNKEVNVIVNMQRGPMSLGQQMVHASETLAGVKSPNIFTFGIPFNKVPYTPDEIVTALHHWQAMFPEHDPPPIHLLGIGTRRGTYPAAIAKLHAAIPNLEISSDSNRINSLFVSGRPSQEAVTTRVDEGARDRIDDEPESDTTELTYQFFNGGDLADFFSRAELEHLAEQLGTTPLQLRMKDKEGRQEKVDRAGGDQFLDNLLFGIAHARGAKAVGPGVRTDVIAESELGAHPPTESELRGAKQSLANEQKRRAAQASLLQQGGALPPLPTLEDYVKRRRFMDRATKESNEAADEQTMRRVDLYWSWLRDHGLSDEEIRGHAIGSSRWRPQTPSYIADGLWQKMREIDPSIDFEEFKRAAAADVPIEKAPLENLPPRDVITLTNGPLVGKVVFRGSKADKDSRWRAFIRYGTETLASHDTYSEDDAESFLDREWPHAMDRLLDSPRATVDPAQHKTLKKYLQALGYQDVRQQKNGRLLIRIVTPTGKRFMFRTDGAYRVVPHNKTQAETKEFSRLQRDLHNFAESKRDPLPYRTGTKDSRIDYDTPPAVKQYRNINAIPVGSLVDVYGTHAPAHARGEGVVIEGGRVRLNTGGIVEHGAAEILQLPTAGGTIHGGTDVSQAPQAPAGQVEGSGAAQRPGAPGDGAESPGVDQARADVRRAKAARRAERRAAKRHNEAETLQELVDKAVARGYTGDPAILRSELESRLALVKETNIEYAETGRDPFALLRAIAKHGGISARAEGKGGEQGEIRWLKEAQDTRPFKPRKGQQARARGNLRTDPVISGQVNGVAGVIKDSGLSLDGMVEALGRQYEQFAYITDVKALQQALIEAVKAVPPEDVLQQFVKGLGPDWWAHLGPTPTDAIDPALDDQHDALEDPEGGDDSFNPEELERPVYTTPGTRLKWSNGTEWAQQAEVLRTGRGISAKVHRDRKSHLDELGNHIHEMVAAGQTREDLEAIRDHVNAWYKPVRGKRGGTNYEIIINEVNNAIAGLEKTGATTTAQQAPQLTIGPKSHVDHGLSPEHMAWLQEKYGNRDSFFIDTTDLPEHLAPLENALYGPIVGDEPVAESDVHYATRADRPWQSRMVDRPLRPTRQVTVIAGPSDGKMTLYTAFGGPLAAQEVGDPNARSKAESEAFWGQHALATGKTAAVDVNEFGEPQTRLPGEAGAQRPALPPTFQAPQQASGDDFTLETPLTPEQQAQEAKAAKGPELFAPDDEDDFGADLDKLRKGGEKPQFSRVPDDTTSNISVEATAGLQSVRVKAEEIANGYVRLSGKTYDIKDKIREHGGRYDGATKTWIIPGSNVDGLAAAVKTDSGRPAPLGSTRPLDPRVAQLREAADGGADHSELEQPVESYLGPGTADLIRDGGLKIGMPEHVVNEQVEDVARIVRAFQQKKPVYILASEPGSGKTFVMGGAIRELLRLGVKRVMFVTLNQGLITQVKNDLASYGIGDTKFITYSGIRGADVEPTDLLIFDEAHNIKNVRGGEGSAQQAKAAAKWIAQAKYTVLASATPFENPVEAAYLEPSGLFDDDFGDFATFAEAYGASRVQVTPERSVLVWLRTRTSDADAAAMQAWFSRQGIYTSRRIRLFPEQLDSRLVKTSVPQTHADRYRDLTESAAMQQDKMGGFASAWIKNFQKRLLEAAKIDRALAEAQAALDRGRFPIIFVETKAQRTVDIPHLVEQEAAYQRAAAMAAASGDTKPARAEFGLPPQGVVDVLEHYMGISGEQIITIPSAEKVVMDRFGEGKVAIYTGSVPHKQAQKNLDAWRAGTKPIIVSTMAKGGTGLSLHDKVGDHQTTQINVNLPWTATGVVQVAQRSARYGLKGKAEVQWVFANNIPFDRDLAQKVGGRMADMGSAVHGQRLNRSDEVENWSFDDALFSEQQVHVSREELQAIADKRGTTLEEQIKRARAAGYSVPADLSKEGTWPPCTDDVFTRLNEQRKQMLGQAKAQAADLAKARENVP